MATATDFVKMVPGFDFMQNLMKNAGAGLPNMSQWVAPTLDPEEIDKRIQELRTVQFWLEQNAKMLAATIQALEVQRMTLATLKTMNLPMAELRDSLKLEPMAADAPAAAAPSQAPASALAPAAARGKATGRKKATAPAANANAAVDPMQWWGALTRQFTELAANALKDSPAEAARQMAGQAFQQAAQPLAAAAAGAGAAAKRKR